VILVSGATGTIGVRLVAALVARGHRVRALVLPEDALEQRLDGIPCERVRGDITRADSLARAFDGVKTVYHLAAVVLADDAEAFRVVNVGGTQNMLEAAARAGVDHFILVSSASVVYPRTTPYSVSKRACEALVRQSQVPYTIVRPTLVYENSGGQEFKMFAEFLRRCPVVPLPGGGRALKNPVHIDDLIGGLLALAANTVAIGKVYNLCGGEEVSLRDLVQLLLQQQGVRRLAVSIPLPLCEAAAWFFGALTRRKAFAEHTVAGLTQDANLDPADACADLDYRPIGIRQGLRQRVTII